MLRSKPEIMSFHCYTREMSETTKYQAINDGSGAAARFPGTQAYSESVFNLKRMQENVAISKKS